MDGCYGEGDAVSEILVEVRPATASGDIARRLPAVPESFASRAGEVTDTITQVTKDIQDHLESSVTSSESRL